MTLRPHEAKARRKPAPAPPTPPLGRGVTRERQLTTIDFGAGALVRDETNTWTGELDGPIANEQLERLADLIIQVRQGDERIRWRSLPPSARSPEVILTRVLAFFNLTPQELTSSSKLDRFVAARRLFIRLARELTIASYPELAPLAYRSGCHSAAITGERALDRDLAAGVHIRTTPDQAARPIGDVLDQLRREIL